MAKTIAQPSRSVASVEAADGEGPVGALPDTDFAGVGARDAGFASAGIAQRLGACCSGEDRRRGRKAALPDRGTRGAFAGSARLCRIACGAIVENRRARECAVVEVSA